MKILLLNSNPVVNKLVVLSAQKVNDTIETFEDIDSIRLQSHYDLLIVDDSVYSNELFDELQQRVTFQKSLYICSKNTTVPPSFNTSMKKPFLPTDLVEELVQTAKSLGITHQPTKPQEESFKDVNSLDNNNFELEELNEISLDGDINKDFDIFEDIDLTNPDDDFNLDDDINIQTSDTKAQSSILDKDDLLEVQSLLDDDKLDENDISLNDEKLEIDENFDNDFNLDDLTTLDETKTLSTIEDEDLDTLNEPLEDFDEKNLDSNDDFNGDFNLDELSAFVEDAIDFEDVIQSAKDRELEDNQNNQDFTQDDIKLNDDALKESEDLGDFSIGDGLEDEFNLEETQDSNISPQDEIEEDEIKEEFSLDETQDTHTLNELEDDFESSINETLNNLTPDALSMEVDDSLLSQIDMLSSKELKIALGEELVLEDETNSSIENKTKESFEPVEDESTNTSSANTLKKLLQALSDKDIVASLDGKKISINITIG